MADEVSNQLKRSASELKKEKSKAAKRQKQHQEKAARNEDFDLELQIKRSIGNMNGPLIADYISGQLRRFKPDISTVELDDCIIPGSAFGETFDWPMTRTANNLSGFVEHCSTKPRDLLSLAPSVKGSPHTIVICAAGIRAADVTRAFRGYQTKTAAVAKLFAKHIKLKEAIEHTKTLNINFGVGTPQRLIDLIEAGSLQLAKVERVVIDASWSGAKKRTIMDMAETLVPLMQLLSRPELKNRYKGIREIADDDGIDLLVF